MRVILIGPQGAGKGTQARRISEKTGARVISTGDMVRAEIKAGTELGRKVKEYNDRGELVPDEIIVEMAKPHLGAPEGWVLDGFPRTEAQARALEEVLAELGVGIDRVIALEAPDGVLVDRLSGRRQSQATGRMYHVEYDPPPQDSDEDPGPFVQRDDDTEEAIRRRLELYHEQTEPLKRYYAQQGLLAEVDATRSIPEVTEQVMKAIRENG
ncbi:MAG: adenylate kinase [Rubrobacteraceae bacterium]|uniref:adenylate kinase n=1 Tax=Rubrobacter naiadicus TaxID=1392641 RepID=UPI002362A101|nr:adenylate kinase [Rubrobacter naiadicus]MBX6763974.1 adenylate kinase [Rubrobacteraceae bacterium]MCL6438087.1 adenylate kinase [Rubrobacteraceae bacterium]